MLFFYNVLLEKKISLPNNTFIGIVPHLMKHVMLCYVEYADEICGGRSTEATGELCNNDDQNTRRQDENRRRPSTG